MKINFIFLFTLVWGVTAFPQETINSIKSDNWSVNSSWDLNRQPREGDVITISPGNTVVFDASMLLNNVVIRVYGTLVIRHAKEMHLNRSSVVNILSGGKLSSESQSGYSFIKIDGLVKYRGNKSYNRSWEVGAVHGLASASHSTGDIDFGGSGFILGSLPVVIWQDFNVFKTNDNKVKMVWVTSHETGSRLFEIERSTVPDNFRTIGTIKSSGNLGSQNIYTFIDDFPGTGKVFYRIKHVDPDGAYKYSAVRLIKLYSDYHNYLIYPNPTRNEVTVSFSAELQSPMQILIYRQNGQIVKKIIANTGMNRIVLDISNEQAGMYYLKMLHPNGTSETLPFTKF